MTSETSLRDTLADQILGPKLLNLITCPNNNNMNLYSFMMVSKIDLLFIMYIQGTNSLGQASHHLHYLHLSINAQVIEEGDEVFLHLNAVVVHLSHSENAHLALSPHL